MGTGRNTRVVLIDRHRLARDGVKWCLSSDAAIEIVGEAETIEEAFKLKIAADVTILEIGTAELCGLSLRSAVKGLKPSKTLVFSWQASHSLVSCAQEAGAGGCLMKTCSAEELVAAVRDVVCGRPVFPARLQVLERQGETLLSSREVEVARLVATGEPSHVIASTLGVGVRTVESHRRTIKRKLGLTSSAELVRFAIENFPAP